MTIQLVLYDDGWAIFSLDARKGYEHCEKDWFYMFARKLMKTRTTFFALITLFAFAVPSFAADQGFSHMPGRWVGNGWLQLSSGDRETIRCTATYFVKNGGKTLNQNLRCASASYTVKSRGALSNQDGKVSGTWNEETFDISGNVTGTTRDGVMKLVVSGRDFKANMSVTTRGHKQSVVMSLSGRNIKKLVINLRKG